MKVRNLSAVIALCLAAGQMQAYDFISGGVAYNILSNTNTSRRVAVTFATTTPDASGYVSTYKGNVTIPAQASRGMQTFNVTQIGDLAMFNNQGLYTLKLPEGIVSIGSQAFSHCYSMYEINIPTTVSRIADYAFEYCEDLKTINLPARLSVMGDGVFQQCFGLQSINVDADCAEFKSIDGVLYSNINADAGMTLLAYPGAREDTDYVMPDNVAAIDPYALSANRTMRGMTLSKGVAGVDGWTFMECEGLEAVDVAEDCLNYSSDNGVLLSADGKQLVYYPIKRSATTYEMPADVVSIGTLGFFCSTTIEKLAMPASLTNIGELAFYGCRSIKEVTCNAVTPPRWSQSSMVQGAGLFDTAVYRQATLYVPEEAVDAYLEAPGWNQFKSIRPIGSAAIDDVTIDAGDTAAEYFDLQGRRIQAPVRGITIVRRGDSTIKVAGK